MQDQPKMKPYRGTSFFGDGLSSRQPIEGTVARGFLRSDTEYFTGKKAKAAGAASATATPGVQQQTAGTRPALRQIHFLTTSILFHFQSLKNR
jgi:hypothetical protein